MSCYHPIEAFRTPTGVVFQQLGRHDIIGRVDLPCGQCLGCRLKRSRDWSVRVMHEASLWDRNSFVTLTYSPENLPEQGFLRYRDYQLFMKRLRKYSGHQVRFFMCGEYGPLNLRPHYHACLFNIDFPDQVVAGKSGSGQVFYTSDTLAKLWGLGHVSVQPLTSANAAYTARYVVDKVTGQAANEHYRHVDEDGVIHQRPPEFSRCSLRPGIGARWFERYGRDVLARDSVVVDGSEFSPPKYYDKLFKRSTRQVDRDGFVISRDLHKEQRLDRVQFAREQRAREAFADNTDERLRVREQVHQARVRNLKRDQL